MKTALIWCDDRAELDTWSAQARELNHRAVTVADVPGEDALEVTPFDLALQALFPPKGSTVFHRRFIRE